MPNAIFGKLKSNSDELKSNSDELKFDSGKLKFDSGNSTSNAGQNVKCECELFHKNTPLKPVLILCLINNNIIIIYNKDIFPPFLRF